MVTVEIDDALRTQLRAYFGMPLSEQQKDIAAENIRAALEIIKDKQKIPAVRIEDVVTNPDGSIVAHAKVLLDYRVAYQIAGGGSFMLSELPNEWWDVVERTNGRSPGYCTYEVWAGGGRLFDDACYYERDRQRVYAQLAAAAPVMIHALREVERLVAETQVHDESCACVLCQINNAVQPVLNDVIGKANGEQQRTA